MEFFAEFSKYERFRKAWEAVSIVRSVPYSLFTFGDSNLSYFLICSASEPNSKVSIVRGDVKITRPLIVMADNAPPEFRDFFESQEDEAFSFMLSRSARFNNLKFANSVESKNFVSDNVEEVVATVNRKLDDEEEDGIGVITAPAGLGGVGVLRYCVERMAQSAPDNLTELQERGFLSDC